MQTLNITIQTNNRLTNLQEDFETLNKILLADTDNQISGTLFDSLSNNPLKATFSDITKDEAESFIKSIDFIAQLGWIEHTSDWDPYFVITYKNDETFETDNGYYAASTHDEHITFHQGQDEETDEDIYIDIRYEDIKSISIER